MAASSEKRVRYPLGTIAYYGPDNTLATKLVASVRKNRNLREPAELHRWISQAGDVRQDPVIGAEVVAFFKRLGVRQTVAYDRIIGCPHEEGIDYPMGRACPHCPFWANIDRFTHEPRTTPVPTMSPDQILAELSREEQPSVPRAALGSADAHREPLIQPLLDAIERGVADPYGASSGEGMLFSYALYLLAKWREPRAYQPIIRWLSLPGEAAHDLSGHIVTEDGGRILAAVCDGNIEPIKALIADRAADEFCRGAAVQALGLLVAWAEVPREPVVAVLRWLASEGLEREANNAWNNLADACVHIRALEVFSELRRAYEEGLIDAGFTGLDELDEAETASLREMLDRTLEVYPPIDDVAEAVAWWGCFGPGASKAARLAEIALQAAETDSDGDAEPKSGDVAARNEPFRAPPKVGRNDPCPCGSGKKYKKCCGRNEG